MFLLVNLVILPWESVWTVEYRGLWANRRTGYLSPQERRIQTVFRYLLGEDRKACLHHCKMGLWEFPGDMLRPGIAHSMPATYTVYT